MYVDKFGKEIKEGSKIVYPARPGGKGPLQLIAATVTGVEYGLGELTVQPEFGNRPVRIKEYYRVAVIA